MAGRRSRARRRCLPSARALQARKAPKHRRSSARERHRHRHRHPCEQFNSTARAPSITLKRHRLATRMLATPSPSTRGHGSALQTPPGLTHIGTSPKPAWASNQALLPRSPSLPRSRTRSPSGGTTTAHQLPLRESTSPIAPPTGVAGCGTREVSLSRRRNACLSTSPPAPGSTNRSLSLRANRAMNDVVGSPRA